MANGWLAGSRSALTSLQRSLLRLQVIGEQSLSTDAPAVITGRFDWLGGWNYGSLGGISGSSDGLRLKLAATQPRTR